MRIAVIDGQGGGMGRAIVEGLRQAFHERIEILALGTNALATAAMLKAGANEGATGQDAILYNVERVELIVGSLSIIVAHSMLGELNPIMAAAIGGSRAEKLLLPMHRTNIELVGVKSEPLPHLVQSLVARVRKKLEG